MKFVIDVVFLSRKKKVLKVRKNMPKRRVAICLRAHSVLELPAGTLDETGTLAGDELVFSGNFVSLRSYGSTLTIDDKLLERARTVTDIQEKTALVRQALRH